MNNKKKFFKKILFRKIGGQILLLLFLSSVILTAPRPAAAVSMPTIDIAAIGQAIGKMFRDIGQWAKEEARDMVKDFKKESAGLAFRKGVEFFVYKIAQDTAVWVASGAKGQGPMFITQGWGEYLKDAADGAAGAMLDDLTRASTKTAGGCSCTNSDGTSVSKNASNEEECTGLESTSDGPQCTWTRPGSSNNDGGILEGFNLCAPDLDVQLRINLGLSPVQLGRPKCRFSKLKRNWEQEISQASFLPSFQRTFNPEENDLGVALSLHTNLLSQQEQKKLEAGQARLESGGFKPVTDFVSGIIKLPGQSVKELANKPADTTQQSLLQDTGTIIGNAIGVFTNTLAQSFLNNLIKNGFSGGSSGGRRPKANVLLRNPEAQLGAEGVEAAKIRLAQDVKPNFATPGRYDILSELANCPNPSKHGPNDCAITDNMRNAISQKMTVKEAVDKGLFNGTGSFGFTSWDPEPIEPSITDGVPYRSILLMRKYRIVPVGWELAAKYIQYFGKEQKSLNDIIKVYDDASSPFYHFIDPDWVLAAPDAYCKLQGPGPEILSSQVSQGIDLNKDGKFDGPDEEPPAVQVTRNDNYCADEQTCIQQDAKGVCKFYGYCTEEKKTWNFGQNSCNPTFNTCATLANKTSGETVSYLLNTVNFDTCDEKSVGCQQYSRDKINDTAWSTNAAYPDSIHLNAKAATCDQTNAGCRAYISTSNITSLAGANLVQNPSFEANIDNNGFVPFWPSQLAAVLKIGDSTAIDGDQHLQDLSFSNISQSGIAKSLSLSGQSVTISFDLRTTGNSTWLPSAFLSPRTQNNQSIKDNDGNDISYAFVVPQINLTTNWQRVSATIQIPADDTGQQYVLQIVLPETPAGSEQVAIDAVKLEIGSQATPYSNYYPYALGQRVHLKRAPDYLSCQTSVKASDTSDPNADKQECQPYARFCTAAEAGCTRYAPTLGGAPITSVRGDACPAECVGYDTYTQSKTFFESSAFKDLIPKTAKQCSAAAVGCDEFTNLDIEKQGGEAKEYYQQLRFCQKPQTSPVDEGVFYTWEGSDTTGFQLKVFQLKVSNQSTTAPCTNLDWQNANTAICSDPVGADDPLVNTGACISADLGANPDCRQFYNPDGNISYRLLSRTISISNDCRPYRKTSATQTDCTANSGFWDTATSACIYQAIPKEGRRCSAAAAGCREYRGGTSANYRTIFNDTFETGTSGWSGGNLSPVASVVGGHSYKFVSDQLPPISKDLSIIKGSLVGANYILSFWARRQNSVGDMTISAGIKNTAIKFFPTPPTLSDQWQFYQSDPLAVSANQNVTIEIEIIYNGSSESIYLDNIELKSNINTYYLIKNSGNTPASCLVPEQMLGCQTFRDNKNQTRNVWRFGDACHEKVVGCEAVIDTQNTTKGADAPFSKTFDGVVTIDADKVDYLVNDKAKQCLSEAQGCEALGVPIFVNPSDDTPTGWEKSPAYLLNNPDKYDDTLCRSEQRACMAYTTSKNTEIYFKDPGKFTCNYLSNRPQAGWYHNVCSNNNQFCITAADCKKDDGTLAIGASCNTPSASVGPNCENNGTPRTLAIGITEPASGWVGVCPAEQNSCTEFIDPRSDSARNLVYNGSFVLNADNNNLPDGWVGQLNAYSSDNRDGVKLAVGNSLNQAISLSGRKLYSISSEVVNDNAASTAAMRLNCIDGNGVPVTNQQLSSPDGSMTIFDYGVLGGYALATITTPSSNDRSLPYQRFSGLIYINSSGTFQCMASIGRAKDLLLLNAVPGIAEDVEGNWFRNISLREATINYQFADRVDRTGCNGLVDNNTCVLFNERSVSSDRSIKMLRTSYRGVGFDADTSPESSDSKIPNSKMDKALPEFGTCQQDRKCSNISSRSCTIDQDCALPFDSNALIKVTPDRQCAAWLSCRTARTITTGGVTKKVCLDVQSCEAVDDNGNCTSQVLADAKDKDLTFSAANVDLIQNRSGFSRVGFDWKNGRVIQGYMSPAQMPQVGEKLPIVNGDFESASKSGNPSGWFGWQNGENFRVISNPVEAQKVGVFYPREGRNILEVNANHSVPANANISGFIPVSSDTEYVISAYLNTLHFTGQSVEARVYEYDKDRNAISSIPIPDNDTIKYNPTGAGLTGNYSATLNLGPGFDWSLMVDKFKTQNTTSFIRLQFAWDAPGTCTTGGTQCYSDASCGAGNGPCVLPSVGLWYLDDIKIQPALKYQRNEKFPNYTVPDFAYKPYERGLETVDYHYAPQSCRLYPEADALSCAYHDDKGLRHKGKLGYCLEWDPQNSNYCIQWWPVDTVIGEDTGEDVAGYSDRAPLYYCLNARGTTSSDYIDIAPDTIGTPPFYRQGGADPDQAAVALKSENPQVQYKITQPGTGNYGPTVGLSDIPGACDQTGDSTGCEIKIWTKDYDECGQDNIHYAVDVGQENSNGAIVWTEIGRVDKVSPNDPICPDGSVDFFDIANAHAGATRFSHLRLRFTSTNPDDAWVDFENIWIRPAYGCTAVAQVVTPTGENRSWSSRLLPNSSYEVQDLKYKYSADYPPFGGTVPPEPVENPTVWDGSGLPGIQPIPVEEAITTDSELPAPYQVRAGRPYSCEPWPSTSQCGAPFDSPPVRTIDDGINHLKMLFIQSYGVWQWNSTNQQYSLTNQTWNAPIRDSIKDERCDSTPATPPKDNIRPPMTDPSSFCAVAPQVPTITISGPQTISRTGAVTLSFTAIADADQLPITQYIINWGDGTSTKQTGLRLQSRPTQQNAITLVHTYTYSDIVRSGVVPDCSSIPCKVTVTPRIQITDNWNWCNGNYLTRPPKPNPFEDQNGYYGTQCSPSVWNSTCTDDAVNGKFGSCRVSGATITVSE